VDALKTSLIFLLAVLGELGGTYAIWRWRRLSGSPWLVAIGLAALLGYAVVQTFQPESEYARLYAAYAGVFLIGAMLWGWRMDGFVPDRFDIAGAFIVLIGMATILWGRRLLG
jgi:small multidrug resistance family-3 protein